MSNIHRIAILLVLGMLATSCAAPATSTPSPLSTATVAPATSTPSSSSELPELKIARYPESADFSNDYLELTSIPKYDPNSTDGAGQVDLRSKNLTKIDLTTSLADLTYATFDSKTQWPTSDKMPVDFDWHKIMEVGKDPGLGIRNLHGQGITGKGIGIAIIDYALLVDHIEYTDRIRVYEESEDVAGFLLKANMHGTAITSIAAGRTVGVAPEADLYFIAMGDCGGAVSIEDFDYSCRAKAIRRIVEINKSLPADRKIRVLSMSFGWTRNNKGSNEILAAVNEAKAAGIFVVSANIGQTYKFKFQGLGRDPLEDPNQFKSFIPGLWWEKDFFAGRPSERYAGIPSDFYSRDSMKQILLVPMDSRTTASPTGTKDYVFYREGGWSWSIPYLAGMYALATQVKPEITPDEFWTTALKTGRTIRIQHDGKDYEFGVILDPQVLIEAIKGK